MAGLFGGKPKVQPPATMPDDQSPAVIEAKRKAAEAAMMRGGRASTIMTDGGNASQTYAGKTLGAS